jgi:hypothetical protein
MQAGSESGRRPGRASSTSNVKENGNKKKDKESWKCEVCSTEAKKEDDKMVQCEWCSKYYCIVLTFFITLDSHFGQNQWRVGLLKLS